MNLDKTVRQMLEVFESSSNDGVSVFVSLVQGDFETGAERVAISGFCSPYHCFLSILSTIGEAKKTVIMNGDFELGERIGTFEQLTQAVFGIDPKDAKEKSMNVIPRRESKDNGQ